MKKTTKTGDPSRTSLGAVPDVDFRKYGRRRRNPFAKRIAKEGWELVHPEPSSASLSDMPEVRAGTRGRRNPYAKRIGPRVAEAQTRRVERREVDATSGG